jgi:hypothetical protein
MLLLMMMRLESCQHIDGDDFDGFGDDGDDSSLISATDPRSSDHDRLIETMKLNRTWWQPPSPTCLRRPLAKRVMKRWSAACTRLLMPHDLTSTEAAIYFELSDDVDDGVEIHWYVMMIAADCCLLFWIE